MTLKLVRFAHTDFGVLGRLGRWCVLEEKWRDNKPGISCIPVGTYRCKRSRYHAGGYDTFEITGVPARSRILFHVGNTDEDTQGCVLLGLKIGVIGAHLAVLSSKVAFNLFMNSLKDVNEFDLEVSEYEG